jgi:hypothetical protein
VDNVAIYQKVVVAQRQLDTAIRLFLEANDCFFVVTLAGAAEEILGVELEHRGLTSTIRSIAEVGARVSAAFDDVSSSTKEIRDRANFARNHLKHHGDPHAPTITVDIRQEAIDMLARAFDNATMLDAAWSDEMYRYNEWFLEHEIGAQPYGQPDAPVHAFVLVSNRAARRLPPTLGRDTERARAISCRP